MQLRAAADEEKTYTSRIPYSVYFYTRRPVRHLSGFNEHLIASIKMREFSCQHTVKSSKMQSVSPKVQTFDADLDDTYSCVCERDTIAVIYLNQPLCISRPQVADSLQLTLHTPYGPNDTRKVT